jgi:hypothetical protein
MPGARLPKVSRIRRRRLTWRRAPSTPVAVIRSVAGSGTAASAWVMKSKFGTWQCIAATLTVRFSIETEP